MAQIPIETPAGAQAKVATHEAMGDPHPAYLSQTEGDARYATDADLSGYATDAELAAGLSGRQPLDSDLTALAGLTPANDDLPQRKAGAWTSRTPAQFKVDLALSYADLLGTVPQSAIPAIAITEYLGAVASQAAMLALVGQRGDWCTRTDLGTDWQLIADNSATLTSWREMTYPASPVQSVSGRTGAVVLAKGDVGLDQVSNLAPSALPVSTAQQSALDAKQASDPDLTAIAALAPADGPVIRRVLGAWAAATLFKGDVGLASVDNTSDVSKPVSTAQQAALNGKAKKLPTITSGDAFRVMPRLSAYVIGVDTIAGLLYLNTTSLFTSTDNITLVTRTLPAGVAAADLSKVIRFGAKIYCTAKDTSGFVKIWQSDPPGTDTAWTAVHTTAATGNIGTAFNASAWGANDYIYCVEYGDPVGGPSIHRSADGTTWTTVLGPITGLRHFHAIAADPYNPGHVYATAGDGQFKQLYRSTSYGATGTWTLLITANDWQAVQISFSTEWVWFAGDTGRNSVYVIDRANPTVPLVAASNYHALMPVPGGLPGRGIFTDGALTGGSPTLTSATAAFTSSDVGKLIRFANVFANIAQQDGVWIVGYNSATSVTLNKNAGGAQTGRQFFVDGDSFYRNAFFGAVDPTTGVYYCISNDNTVGGTRSGLFALTQVGGRLELLESFPSQTAGEIFFWNGSLWSHQSRHSLMTIV